MRLFGVGTRVGLDLRKHACKWLGPLFPPPPGPLISAILQNFLDFSYRLYRRLPAIVVRLIARFTCAQPKPIIGVGEVYGTDILLPGASAAARITNVVWWGKTS